MKPNVKMEEEIDYTVDTRRTNRKWPTDARLVHADRTPCSTECMKTHKDDSDDEQELNKSVKATYGQTNKRTEKNINEKDATPIVPASTSMGNHTNCTSDTGIDIHVSVETGPEVNETSTSVTTLHGVPVKETGKQCIIKDSDLHTGSISPARNQEELHGVPTKPAAKASTSNNESAGTVEKSLDTSIMNDESTLPVIEHTKGPTAGQSDDPNPNINLQQDLTPEDVNMNTGNIEDLCELGNLLNLEDDFDTDLPLVGDQGDMDDLEPAMDLEIAMDYVRFIAENPIHGPITTSRSNKTTSRTVWTSTKMTSGTASNTSKNNAKGARVSSPRGVMQITSHVLRKLTPEEKKGKKIQV